VRKLHHPPARNADGTINTAAAAAASSIPEEDESGSDDDDENEADAAGEAETIPVPPASAFALPTDPDVLLAIRTALNNSLTSETFNADVQTVKGLLFERKWLELFTDAKLLDAYAGRWAPSRALAFRELLTSLKDVRALFAGEGEEDGDESEGEGEGEGEDEGKVEVEACAASASARTTHVLSIGGGAGSELLAFAALATAGKALKSPRLHWVGADIGDWSDVLTRIDHAAKDRWAYDAEFEFIECDVLAPAPAPKDDDETSPTPLPFLRHSPDLTTIFFTLTELLSQNRARTLALLRSLTAATAPGALLLVADSASDIAQFSLGKDGRTWPVYMVLDALLAAPGGKSAVPGWERIRKEDSKWYRLPEGVGAGWPCKLENARYWMRLYRRV
jgi:25S rRNA (uracil2843-N3)-methyltransferase